MKKIHFTQLSIWIRLSLILVPVLAWVMFAEFVIDRHGLDAFLPFYRVGNICIYDVGVLAFVLIGWWRAEAREKRSRAAKSLDQCC